MTNNNNKKVGKTGAPALVESYKQIVELSPDIIFVHRDGIIVFMNQAGLRILGATSADQMIGKSIWELFPPERHGIVRSRMQLMRQTNEAAPLIEHTILRIDNGMPVHVEATARIIDYEGEPAFYMVMRDISEHVKTRLLLEMQYAVSKNFIESEYLVDATTNVLKTLCDKLKLSTGKIWHFDKKAGVLRCIASWSRAVANNREANKHQLQEVLQPKEGVVGNVFNTDDAEWINLEEAEYKTCIVLPIRAGHEEIGVVELLSTNSIRKDTAIMQALNGISDQIGAYIKRKNSERELRYISKHDIITGLSNRYLFEENLSYEINLAKNNDQRLALLYFDIDAFSTINGAMGNAAGDQLLKQIAERLTKLGITLECMSRIGDDQFAIILRNVNSVKQVTEFIQKLNSTLKEPFSVGDASINITVSIGVGFYPEDGEDVHSLMRGATIALATAKQAGSGTFQFSNFNITSNAIKKINMGNDLRQALARNEFSLCYQPVVGTPDLTVKGFECLLRWRRNGILVAPADFIPMIENSHLIIPVGEWMIKVAAQQCKIWQSLVKQPVFASVNVRGIQFKHGNLPDLLSRVLQETGLDPKCFAIEITEATIMDQVEKNIKVLRKIKDLGVKIAMDEFGSGYSSLNYLRNMPVDFLKIDESFVRTMLDNSNDAAIVKTIIELGNNLGYALIAEGVETKDQLNFINHLGCNLIQGYYFSRPLEAQEATKFLQQGKLLG